MKVEFVVAGLMAGASPVALIAQTPATPATPARSAAAPARSAAAIAAADDEDGPEITVTGQRLRGSVEGDIKPEVSLSPADIRSYGVSSIADLLSELSPQTSSGQGRGGEQPVVLLNGKRISGFAEIRDIPTDAIQRVEILPEEVALKYGYSATQKVVNFVLRPRFQALTGELTGGAATQGDYATQRAEVDVLRIRNDARFSLGFDYKHNDQITEGDRGVVAQSSNRPYDYAGNITAVPGTGATQIDPALSALKGSTVTVAGVPASAAGGVPALNAFGSSANVSDIGAFRSLTPASTSFTANAVLAHPITDRISGTLNASFGTTATDSLRGPGSISLLLPAGDPFSPFTRDVQLYRYLGNLAPLYQSNSGVTGHLGGTANGDIGAWRWNLTGNYDRTYSRTISLSGIDATSAQALLTARSATFNPFATIDPSLLAARTDRATSTGNTGNLQMVTSGPLFDVPAGQVRATVKVGGTFETLDAFSLRSGLIQQSDLSRRDANGQLNLDVPLTSRRDNVLAAIGTLSVNGNVAVDRYSDFGTLTTYGYGLHYGPRDRIDLIASFTREEGAPTISQLGGPQIVTAAVPFYDPVTGRTVEVSQLSGGNPNLTSDTRRVFKLGLTVKPFEKIDFSLTANYVHSRTDNAIANLPTAIAAAIQAFPDRFVRNSSGDLTSIDTRSVNFARETSSQLRWGFNFSKPIKSNTAKLIAAFRAANPNGVPRPQSIFGGPAFGGGGGQGQGQRGPGQGTAAPAATGQGTPVVAQADGQTPPTPPPGDRPPGDVGGPPGGGPPGGFGGGGGGGPGGGGRGGPGGRFGGGGGQNGGRLQVAFYHTVYFRDDILIRPGVPLIDLLGGGATGTSGGQPRHLFELQGGYSNNGIGFRLSGKYQTATDVQSGLASTGTTGNLHFLPLATANLRLFVNLAQLPSLVAHPWARGMRVSLNVTNAFNQRIRVTDASGATPLSYQPGYLDPIGRAVTISVRKLFF